MTNIAVTSVTAFFALQDYSNILFMFFKRSIGATILTRKGKIMKKICLLALGTLLLTSCDITIRPLTSSESSSASSEGSSVVVSTSSANESSSDSITVSTSSTKPSTSSSSKPSTSSSSSKPSVSSSESSSSVSSKPSSSQSSSASLEIVINEDAIDRDVVGLCRQIRRDEDNTITPVIVVSSNGDKHHRMKILQESIEYYIKKPVDEEYLYYTVKNLNRLLSINRRISPLTGLPGNVQIHAELKKRLLNKEAFSMLYFDLDNFKAYNDVYGFLKGDQIIEFTARVILKGVHSSFNEDVFVGHVGGDDFVAILPTTNCEKICQNIIAMFDSQVGQFFTDRDLEKGYIEVANRKGIIEQFPLTSLSIGVVVADVGRFSNILEIGEVGGQVKHAAKSVMGSSYAVDRRK